MTLFDFFLLLNSSGIVTGLVTLVCLAGIAWWTWQCSIYVGDLCLACKAEMQQERESPSILVQATPDMTATQLAALLRDAEAIIQAEQSTVAQS